MTANSLVYAAGWGLNDICTSAQGQALQVQAGQSVNRTNTHTGWRSVPLIVCASGNWETDDNGKIYFTDIAAPRRVNIPLADLPNGHVMVAVRVWIKPAAGHGAVPANLPIVRVFKRPTLLVANATQLGIDVSPAAGSVPAYETGEGVDVTGLAETIDLDSNSYFAQLVNEHGANAATGLSICGVDVRVTIDTAYGGQDLTMWRKDVSP